MCCVSESHTVEHLSEESSQDFPLEISLLPFIQDSPLLGSKILKGAPGGCCAGGLSRDLNPGPLAPEARIIPLDH